MSSRRRIACIILTIICIIMVLVEMCQAQPVPSWQYQILLDWQANQQTIQLQDPHRFNDSYTGGAYVPDEPAQPTVITIRREYTVWDREYYLPNDFPGRNYYYPNRHWRR